MGSQPMGSHWGLNPPSVRLLPSAELSPMSAYMSGKLKLSGKQALAQKLGSLLSSKGGPRSKL